MTDKIRKYILPQLPYVLIGWFCLKLGTAYRLAAGGNFGEKLVATIGMIGPAFDSFAPGLVLFDWLVGLAGAVAMRLIIWNKVKKARNSEGMWSMAAPDGETSRTSSLLSTPFLKTM